MKKEEGKKETMFALVKTTGIQGGLCSKLQAGETPWMSQLLTYGLGQSDLLGNGALDTILEGDGSLGLFCVAQICRTLIM